MEMDNEIIQNSEPKKEKAEKLEFQYTTDLDTTESEGGIKIIAISCPQGEIRLVVGRPSDPTDIYGVISTISVKEDSRGMGIGSQLLDAAERTIKEHGKKQVNMFLIENNEPWLIQWLERKGYKINKRKSLSDLKFFYKDV